MNRVTRGSLFGIIAAVGAACSSDAESTWLSRELPQLRRQGYRVAVMPFTVNAPEDGFLTAPLAALGNVLSLGGLPDDAPARLQAAHLMRRGIVWSLADSPFDVVALWVTDTQLDHQAFDPQAATPQEIAAGLGVDGLIYGEVTAWNRTSHMAQTYVTVAASLRLVDGISGKTLFEARHQEEIAVGSTGGPTGPMVPGTERMVETDDGKLITAGRRLVRHLAGELAGREPRAMLRPEAGGGMSPTLAFVSLARENDGPVPPGGRIRVVAIGTPGANVRFSIGHYQTDIPMPMITMDEDPRGNRATYVGSYVVQEGERLPASRVVVTIEKFGLRNSRHIASGQIGGARVTIGGGTSRKPAAGSR